MTIIVYRDGVMAADTLATQNGSRAAHVQKIIKHAGWLVGGAGHLGVAACAIKWLDAGADTGKPLDFGKISDSSLILISPDLDIYYCHSEAPHLVKESAQFMVAGSGSDIARGALHMGATAQEAVIAAMTYDLGCGGKCLYITAAGPEDLALPKEIYKFVNPT